MGAVSQLPSNVLQKISEKANELEVLKSEKMLLEVSIEQTEHSSGNRIKVMKTQLTDTLQETQSLRTKINQLETEKASIEKNLYSYQSKSSGSDDELRSIRSCMEMISSEKRQAIEILERRNNEIVELKSSIDEARKQNIESRKSIIELENSIQKATSEARSAKFKEQNYRQELEHLRKTNEWLDGELKAKTQEFSSFRKAKIIQISSLQTDLDTSNSDLESLRQSHDVLKEKYSEISTSLDTALIKNKDLQDSQTVADESFRAEMASQIRLCELWECSAKDAKARVEELEELIDAERERETQEVANWKTQAEEAIMKSEKLESQLSALESQMEGVFINNDANSNSPENSNHGNESSKGVFSPSALIISEIQRGGGSLVQLYTDFQDTKKRLEREKSRNLIFQRDMDKILEELENHAPTMLAERDENKRLESELTHLSELLEVTSKENEALECDNKTLKIRANDADRDIRLHTKKLQDLSRQVRYLLIQNQVRSDSEGPLTPEEQAALQKLLNNEDLQEFENDTDRVISQRLILFKNIAELQSQNEKLISVARKLGQQMELKEQETVQRLESLESSAVEQAKEAIQLLQQEIRSLKTKSEALLRERDMFRRMLSNKTGEVISDDSEESSTRSNGANVKATQQLIIQNEEITSNLKELQSKYDNYQQETTITIKTLDEQIANLSKDRGDLQIQLAKTKNQNELAEERFKSLSNSLQFSKTENEELKKRSQALQDTLHKQDIRTQQVAEELVDAKSLSDSLRNEVSNLKAEKSLWKSVEQRLSQDNESLLEERGRLNTLVSNLQSIEAERERAEGENRRRLITQVEVLEKEVVSVKKHLEDEVLEVKRVTARKEIESKEYQTRIDKLTTDLSTTRETLISTKANHDTLQTKVNELTILLNSTQEKLDSLQRPKDASETSEDRLNEEILSLKTALDLSKSELSMANNHIEELTNVAKAAEEALENMNNTHDQYKATTDAALKEKDTELANLQDRLDVISQELNESTQELLEFEIKRNELLTRIEIQKQEYGQTIKELESNASRILTAHEILKKDLENQAKIASEAQESYEKELVKHADAARALQEIRVANVSLKEKLQEVTKAAENASEMLKNSEISWETQKDSYVQEIDQLKARCDDIKNQNRLLLDQLDNVTSSVSKFKSTNGVTGNDNDDDAEFAVSNSSDEDLRDIIRYLRREKEIVDCQYEVALQETKRLKQRLDHTTASLDEVRLELTNERQRESDSARLAIEHKELLEKINELNILRESNSSLRSENIHNLKRVHELETEIQALTAKLEPIQAKLQDAVAESEGKDEQIKLVQEDNERWKARTQQILQKYDRVDPAELQGLKDKVELLESENTKLSTKSDELNNQLIQLTAECEEYKAKLQAATTSSDETKKSSTELQEKLDALQGRFNRLKNESQEKLSRRRTEAQELKHQILQVTTLQDQAQKALEAKQKELDDLKLRFEALQKEIEESK
ncbi:hypothetical protein NADFUDRAFT_20212, partial [Nadsonia fulvescens var. elongata DSM 6958]